jgi:hypothetical protein
MLLAALDRQMRDKLIPLGLFVSGYIERRGSFGQLASEALRVEMRVG